MDVEKYITDQAVRAITISHNGWSPPEYLAYSKAQLRAVLPGILAQHRADVLREAVARIWGVPNSSLSCVELQRMTDGVVGK